MVKHSLILTAREASIAKRLVERAYALPGKVRSETIVQARDMLRDVADAGGTLRLTEPEGEAFGQLLATAMAKRVIEFTPTEIDMIEAFFLRVEFTFKVRLRA